MAQVPWLGQGAGRPFYAVGGTWRAIARLHMEQTNYPLHVMHGYAIPTRRRSTSASSCARPRSCRRFRVSRSLPSARREVLPYGALVLERLLKTLQPSEVVFSVFGIREGLIYACCRRTRRRGSADVASATSTPACARAPSSTPRSCASGRTRCSSRPAPRRRPEERRLRHAACLISDIGWRAHPDYRGEQSLNPIAHAGLGGIDHPGRVFLALADLLPPRGSRRTTADSCPSGCEALVSKRAQKRARIVGAAIRAAHMLSIGMAGVIDETPLSYEGDKLVLTIPKSYAGLDGERLRRRFERWPQSDRQSRSKSGLAAGDKPLRHAALVRSRQFPDSLLVGSSQDCKISAMADDPYDILGVSRRASDDEIRRAFRKLAKELHPDLNPDNAAADERFKKVSAAYEILAIPTSAGSTTPARSTPTAIRAARSGGARPGASAAPRRAAAPRWSPGGAGFRGFGFADIFSDVFGGAGLAGRERPRALPPRARTCATPWRSTSSRP